MATYTYTIRYTMRYPDPTAPTNVPGDLENPLDRIDNLITPTYVGTASGRPVAGTKVVYTTTAHAAVGTQGRRYYTTTHGKIAFDNGSQWLAEGPINTITATITQSTPGNTALSGNTGFSADAGHTHARETWGLTGDYQPAGVASAGTAPRVARSDHIHPGPTVGVPIPWPSATIPAGCLPYAGQVEVRASYPILFSILGTTWNTGGETVLQFRMPDFRNRALVGAGTLFTVGHYYGSNTVTLTTAQMPYHRHPVTFDHTHTGTTNTAGSHFHATETAEFIIGSLGSSTIFTNQGSNVDHSPAWNLGGSTPPMRNAGTHNHGFTTSGWSLGINPQYTDNTGASHAHTNVQPSAGVTWITLAG